MGMKEFNAALLQELKCKSIIKKTIQQKDILAWNTDPKQILDSVGPDEMAVKCERLGVYVIVSRCAIKRSGRRSVENKAHEGPKVRS